MTNTLKILCVPPDMLSDTWAYIGGMLTRGLMEADLPIGESLDRVRAKTYQLWTVSQTDPPKFVAACLTELVSEPARKVLGVYALCGSGAKAWGTPLSDALAKFAKAEGCAALKFCGSPAWTRICDAHVLVGDLRPGVAVMERAL